MIVNEIFGRIKKLRGGSAADLPVEDVKSLTVFNNPNNQQSRKAEFLSRFITFGEPEEDQFLPPTEAEIEYPQHHPLHVSKPIPAEVPVTSPIVIPEEVLPVEEKITPPSSPVRDPVLDDIPSPHTSLLEKIKNIPSTPTMSKKKQEYWMPDSECRYCYDCQASFTTFRRKHHCRICGQVFCWKCSNNLIKLSDRPLIRACNNCYKATLKLGTSTATNSNKGQYDSVIVLHKTQEAGNEEFVNRNNRRVHLSQNLRKYTTANLSSAMPRGTEEFDDDDSDVEPSMDDSDIESPSSPHLERAESEELIFDREAALNERRIASNPKRKTRTLELLPEIGKNMKQPSENGKSVDNTAMKAIRRRADVHLVNMIKQIIEKEDLPASWIDVILPLARRASQSITPWIKDEDKMDVREYVKVKLIPGGEVRDCDYIEGVVFSKNLAHKKMRNDIDNPKILLLNTSLEFQKENRLLLMDDLVNQERSYLKIMVARIAALNPDLVLVGKTVSRLAQEFLLEANIPFALNVKYKVIKRIARATGADILISATDHMIRPTMGQAKKFYVRTYPSPTGPKPLMVLDGAPKELACTILLSGADLPTLYKLKRVMLFSTYIAYNLHLESCLLWDQFGTVLPTNPEKDRESVFEDVTILSSSPGVHFPQSKVREMAAPSLYHTDSMTDISSLDEDDMSNPNITIVENQFDYSTFDPDAPIEPKKNPNFGVSELGIPGNLPSCYSHQNFVYLHSLYCNTTSKQCLPFETFKIDYYLDNDLPLGDFLEQYCFNPSYKCKAKECGRDMTEHDRSFVHGNGRLNLSVCRGDAQLKLDTSSVSDSMLMWTFCKLCSRMTPFIKMTEETWKYSFGKFLELSMYGFSHVSRAPGCGHSLHKDHIRYFFWNNLLAEIEYDTVDVLEVVTPPLNLYFNPLKKNLILEKELEMVTAAANQMYNTIQKRLTQQEVKQKMPSPQNMEMLVDAYKKERNLFFEELSNIVKSFDEVNKVKKTLYFNFMAWKALLEPKEESNILISEGSHRSEVMLGSTPPTMESKSGIIRPSFFLSVSSLMASQTHTSSTQPLFLAPGINEVVSIVYEDESSSLISYALNSVDYQKQLEILRNNVHTRKDESNESQMSFSPPDPNSVPPQDPLVRELLSRAKADITNKFEYEDKGGVYSWKMYCTTHYAVQFRAFRALCCGGEEQFLHSLSRSKNWDARGGKSDATWAKTFDDRFILKEISRVEMAAFLDVAPLYFEYLSNALFQQVPTILGKIFGIYSVRFKNSLGKDIVQNLVVMENLWYEQSHMITKIYDLKGSKRSRYVDSSNGVLLDENLLEVMFANPIWVSEQAKSTLQAAIWNDSLFLSSLGVMDYSLVVGLNTVNKTFVVGIIDYIRKYTWDKQLETWVKSSGLMGGRGKIPTVISPKQYKIRFREAMDFFFVKVPTKSTAFREKHPVVEINPS